MRIPANDSRTFGRWYKQLSTEERAQVVAEQRRKWYEHMVAKGRKEHGDEDAEAEMERLDGEAAAPQIESGRA